MDIKNQLEECICLKEQINWSLMSNAVVRHRNDNDKGDNDGQRASNK